MIRLKDAISAIGKMDYRDGNGTFSISFLTCDRTKKTGGEIITLEKACGMGLPPNCKLYAMRGIKCMETGKPYAVHNYLIFSFNGQQIYWEIGRAHV